MTYINSNRKRLIQFKSKLNSYKLFQKRIDSVLNGELELQELDEIIYNEISCLEETIDNLKIKMDLIDDESDED